MSQDPNELSAGAQQNSSGDPSVPLTRRQLRALEEARVDDKMAAELERQMLGLRPATSPEVQPAKPETVTPAVAETPVPVVPDVPLRRDRSNRPPMAETTPAQAEEVVTPAAEVSDPVVAEANTPVVGYPVVAQKEEALKPTITEPPTIKALA